MVMMAVTNLGREIEFNTENIPITNRSGYGIKSLLSNKLKKNEVITDVYIN